jgi:hypothetical protein
MGKMKQESVKFALGLLVLAALMFFPVPATAKPGDAKDMKLGTWAGAGGHRWLKFGKHIWRVLDVYSHKGQKHALLLAEEPVTAGEFDSYSNDWKKSDIRGWLNVNFYRGAFSVFEQNVIETRTYRYEGVFEGSYKTDSSKIFLLSYDEVHNEKYFDDDNDRAIGNRWWLRSPGLDRYRAALVYSDGVVDIGYVHYVPRSYGIRPALIVNLSSSIFTSSSSKYETLYELND